MGATNHHWKNSQPRRLWGRSDAHGEEAVMPPVQGIMMERAHSAEKLEKILKTYVQAKEKDTGVRRPRKSIPTHIVPTPSSPHLLYPHP